MLTRSLRRTTQRSLGVRTFASQDQQDKLYRTEKMTASEAFVETLKAQEVTDCFGIVGSAFMDALDIFPSAGIRFISVQHEQNAVHMADGYSRVSGKHGFCIAQNGPGISNFVTGMGAAYWAHSPVVAVLPEAGTMTKGLGGFQEVPGRGNQIEMFTSVSKYQGEVNNANRIAEITARGFDYAMNERGPTVVNIPRDFFYHTADYKISKPNRVEKSAGGPASLAAAAELIKGAKNPVILAGGGVMMGEAMEEVKALAEYLQVPVCTTYLHNDSFPSGHPLWMGNLGYLGHKGGMECINKADVVIALGTRLSPFGTLPQYGFDYFPKTAKIIQVEADARRIGLVRSVDVGINGCVKLAAKDLLGRVQAQENVCMNNAGDRLAAAKKMKANWEEELDEMTSDSTLCQEGLMRPRQMLREMEKAMPADAMVATDVGNVCSVSNGYLRFPSGKPSFLAAMTYGNCGYSFPAAMGAKVACPDRPAFAYVGDGAWGMSLNEVLTCVREEIPTTAVVFHNKQWGAEKKNQVLWFGDRYVGVNLKNDFSYADISRSMGAEGITVTHLDQVQGALAQCVENQKVGKTTVLEMMLTRELGDPFRRDAMKLPQRLLTKYQGTNEVSESPTGQPVDKDFRP